MTLAKECGGCTLQWDTNHKCVFQHQKQRKRKLKLKRSFAMKTFLISIYSIGIYQWDRTHSNII